MATELATEFRGPGAQGSHLLLFAGVETNVYCIPCSVVRKCTSLCVAPSLSLWCGVAVLSLCCFLLRLPFSFSGVAVLFLCCFLPMIIIGRARVLFSIPCHEADKKAFRTRLVL